MAGGGTHGDVAAGAARASAHANQAEAAAGGGSGAQTAAVILNRQADLPAAGGKFHLHVLGPGVARDIGQRLLRDAEKMSFRFVGEAPGIAGVYRHLDSGARGEAFRQPAQSGLQAEIVEDGGAQQLRHLAHVADGFIHQAEAIGKARAGLGGVWTRNRSSMPLV